MVFRSGIYATLGSALNPADTSIVLSGSHGARFNTWLATQYDYTWVTVIKMSDPNKPYERIKVAGPLTGDTIPVVARAQDGTTALSFSAGERVEVRLCAPMLERFVEAEDIQTLADLRATSVGGTPNAVTAVHAYPLSDLVGVGNAPADGMCSIFRPVSDNTSTSPTYAPDGLTAKFVSVGGQYGLTAGDLRAGSWAIVVFNSGTDRWELMNPATDKGFVVSALQTVGFTLNRSFHGRVVPCSGAFTVSPSTAGFSGVGADFWCVLQNVGTGLVTIDPAGTEVIQFPDGTQYATHNLGPGGAMMLVSDGTKFYAWPLGDKPSNFTVYRTPGTFTHKWGPMSRNFIAMAVGGGGGGGRASGVSCSSPGGSGGASAIAFGAITTATETVTVGAGGPDATNGGASSLGSIVTAAGGNNGGSYVSVSTTPATPSAGSQSTAGGGGASGTSGTGGFNLGVQWLGSTPVAGVTGTTNGVTNTSIGGGGGGANCNSVTTTLGGTGGPGAVVIWEF